MEGCNFDYLTLIRITSLETNENFNRALQQMKKIFPIITLFLSTLLFSQKQHTIDSLQTLLKRDKHDTSKTIHFNELCTEYLNVSKYDSALSSGNSALQLGKQLNFQKGIASAYSRIGNVYYNQGNYGKAIENYFASLKIREAIGEKQGIANSYNNIGLIYYSQANYSKALENYTASLKIKQEIDDKYGIATSYNNIGLIYYNQGNYSKAMENYSAAMKIRKEIGDRQGIADTYNNMGPVYYSQGDYDRVLENYFASLKIHEEIGDRKGVAISFDNIASTYKEKSNYPEAMVWLQKGLQVSMEIGAKDLVMVTYKELSEVAEKMSDYKNAFQYHQLYSQIKDSVFDEKSGNQIANLQIQYETAKNEKEIELLTNEKKLKETELELRNSIIIGIILISLILIILYSRYYVKQQLTAEKHKLIMEKQLIETEQKLLRLQMNPHFIFNTLTAVQGFINTDRKNEAGKYLSKISRLIRAILENSRMEYIPFEKEILSLENYLNINQLLMNNAFEYKIEIDDTIDREQTFMPPMLAQPFIENALKHGVQDKENGVIIIRFKKNNQTLLFEVEDNGIGLAKPKILGEEKHQSLSTLITKERLANLFRLPLDKIQINIYEIKNSVGLIIGTKTAFEIPVKYS